MLDVSTAHVKRGSDGNPDFGPLRFEAHEYGWIVFCRGDGRHDELPEWIRPIHETAVKAGCFLILFDSDAGVCSEWEDYEGSVGLNDE
jgi:hypothetical protein